MKQTTVEKIISEIDNEVDFLKTHQYIAEVRGRMIGLAFAKRVALELKEMEKDQNHAEYMRGWKDGLTKQQEQINKE